MLFFSPITNHPVFFFHGPVASWFVSPVLSGLMSGALYMVLNHIIFKKDKPLEPGLRALPFIYGITLLVNVFSIVHDGPTSKLNYHYILYFKFIVVTFIDLSHLGNAHRPTLIYYLPYAVLKFNLIPWWGAVITAVAVGFLTSIVIQVVVVPRMRKSIRGECGDTATY